MKHKTLHIAAALSLLITAPAMAGSPKHRVDDLKRKVVLLDFTQSRSPTVDQTPASVQSVTGGMEPIASAMRAEFTPLGEVSTTVFQALSPTTNLLIPTWMQAGEGRGFAPIPATFVPTGCGSSLYRPMAWLKPSVEARRRLIFPVVAAAACEVGLPVGLMDALVIQESRYNPLAVSNKGAFGLSQLMPGTARDLRANPYDLVENVRGGARYLKAQLNEFGRVDLALAAYNAGPGRVRSRRAVPNIRETENYVRTIMASWAGSPPSTAIAKSPPIVIAQNPFRRASLVVYGNYASADPAR